MSDVTEHPVFRLAGGNACREARSRCRWDTPISVFPEQTRDGFFSVLDPLGQILGTITDRHPVSAALTSGHVVLRALINSLGQVDAPGEIYLSVRVVTGPSGASYTPPPLTPASTYTVRLVGHRNYQDVIEECEVEERVTLWHEPDNPFDEEAIAATTVAGKTIGYVPRNSWLHRALLDEGKGYVAAIHQLEGPDDSRKLSIVVQLTGEQISRRVYRDDTEEARRPYVPWSLDRARKELDALAAQQGARLKPTPEDEPSASPTGPTNSRTVLIAALIAAVTFALVFIFQ